MSLKRHLLISAARLDDVSTETPVAVTAGHVEMLLRRRVPRADIVMIAAEPESRAEFAAAAAFERARYERYAPILAERLNQIHGINRDEGFWDRVTGMTLLMHVSNCRRIFNAGMRAAAGDYVVSVLAERDFVTPRDEASYRRHHQYGELGDEQLFAILMRSRDAGSGEFVAPTPSAARPASAAPKTRAMEKGKRVLRRLAADPGWPAREAIVRAFRAIREPQVLVTQCFWSAPARQAVQIGSRGRVIVDDTMATSPKSAPKQDSAERAALAAVPTAADEFDRFFFATLRWSAPASWVEDLPARLKATQALLDRRPSLRAIVNETVDEATSLLLAEAKTRGIELWHCEHNYLQHQFVGNMIWFHLRKFDRYLTLGWSAQSERIVPSGSCFAWTEPERAHKDIELLLVSSVAMVRAPLTSAGYGEAGSHNAVGYAAMTRRFLAGLSDQSLGRMYYRDYPAERRALLFEHPVEATMLDGFRERIGLLERTGAESTTSLIARSKLVVVNYLSTAYNQALLAGVPTIVLFNPEAYYLTDEQRGFYDELIAAGVFQADPAAAASLVESVIDDPDSWWRTPRVQAARANYLRRNFGAPATLLDQIIRKSVGESTTTAAAPTTMNA